MKATVQKTKSGDGGKRQGVDTQYVVIHPTWAKTQITSPL